MTATASPAPPSAPPGPTRAPSAAVLLLLAGAVLILSAATVFVARDWDRLGILGQAAVLAVATAAAAATAILTWRRRLRATSEALVSVTAGLVALDAAGARHYGLVGLDTVPGFAYVTVVAALILALAGITSWRTATTGRAVRAASVVAAGAVTVGATALVGWITETVRQWAPIGDSLASRATTGLVEALLVVGLVLLRPSWSCRQLPGLAWVADTARVVAYTALGSAIALVLVVGAGGLLAREPAVPGEVAARIGAVAVAALALAGWRCDRRRAELQATAADCGWAALALAVASTVLAAGGGHEPAVLLPVIALAAVTRVTAIHPILRTGAAHVTLAAGGLAAAITVGLFVQHLGSLGRGAGDPAVMATTDTSAAAVALAVVAAAAAAVSGLAQRLRLAAVLATAGVVLPVVMWSLIPATPWLVTAISAVVAGCVVVASIAIQPGRQWVHPLPAVSWALGWWLSAAAAALDGPVAYGVLVTVTGVTLIGCAAAATRRAHTAAGVLQGVASMGLLLMAYGVAVTAESVLITSGAADSANDAQVGGAVAALVVSVVAAARLLVLPRWPVVRVAALVVAALASLVVVVVARPVAADHPTAAAVALALLAHSVLGTRAVAGTYPLRPHALRHVLVPWSAAAAAVELVAATRPLAGHPGIDTDALPAVAVLGVAVAYVGMQLRRGRRSAGRGPVTGLDRAVVRDLVLPASVVLLIAATVVAALPSAAALPLVTPLLPLLVGVVGVVIGARSMVRRADPAHVVPLVWVQVVQHVAESLAVLVALRAARPLTGLPFEVDVAAAVAVTVAAHLARTLRQHGRNTIGQRVQMADVVALVTALFLAGWALAGWALTGWALTGTDVVWLDGLPCLISGAWASALAVVVRGPLAGPWPGHRVARGWLAMRVGAALTIVGYLLVLGSTTAPAVEAMSVPLGAVLVVFGLWAMRDAPDEQRMSSMRCLLPGLVVSLGPSLWMSLTAPEDGFRPVVVAGVGAALAVTGALLRWRAVLLVGVVAAVSVAIVQAAPWVSGLPQWTWLAAAGGLTLTLGATYEDQLRRARAAGLRWREMR